MVAQLTYNAQPAVAIPGMIAEMFSLRQIDSWLAGGEIPFGFPVSISSTDPDQVVVATSPSDTFVGISVFAHQLNVHDILTGECHYQLTDQVPVMSKGRVWVLSAGAVEFGEDAFALPDGSGQFSNANVGGLNINLYAKFRGTTTGAGQLVMIELQ